MEKSLTESQPRAAPVGLVHKGKLTPEVYEQIVSMVREGTPIVWACKAAGIDDSTYRKWMEKAEKHGRQSRFYQFSRDIRRAEAQCHAEVVGNAKAITKRDGKTALGFLERKYPDEWGKKDILDVNVDLGPRVAEIMARVVDLQLESGEFELLEEGNAIQGPREEKGSRQEVSSEG